MRIKTIHVLLAIVICSMCVFAQCIPSEPACGICGYYVCKPAEKWLRIDEDGTFHSTFDTNGTWSLKGSKIVFYGPVIVQEGTISGNVLTVGRNVYTKE